MDGIGGAAASWLRGVADSWDRFWFTPAQPHTLAVIRICAGAMLFYTHLVWALDLEAFLGPSAWITGDVARQLHGNSTAWSFLWYIDSMAVLWVVHILGLLVFAMLTIGLFTRIVSVLAWLIAIAYSHRLIGSLFGLDQINCMLAMYLIVGASGAVYSVDHWLARRRTVGSQPPRPRIDTNIAVRLIQLHMCVIYLFSAFAKLEGQAWRDGGAIWLAVANLEYQSLDLTWLVRHPMLIALLTHVTVFWESLYCVLIWPRWSRPVMLLFAVILHGGIAFGLGMITFGTIMLVANFAFVDPSLVEAIGRKLSGFKSRAGESVPVSKGDRGSQVRIEPRARPRRERRPVERGE